MNKLPMIMAFLFSGPHEVKYRDAIKRIKKDPESWGLNGARGEALKSGEVLSSFNLPDPFRAYFEIVLDDVGLGKCVMKARQETILMFKTVQMHTDESFDKFVALIPISGEGTLSVTDGKTVTSKSLSPGMGCVFNNHLPHSFFLESRAPMIVLSGNFMDNSLSTRRCLASWMTERTSL